MTLPFLLVMMVAAAAVAAAAFCALCDGALLSLDEDAPPSAPAALELLGRREKAHRSLAFARIVSLLVAGAAVATALEVNGVPSGRLAPLIILAGVAIVIVAESAARSAGDALGAVAVERLAPVISGVERVLRPVVLFGTWSDAVLHRLLPAAPPGRADHDETIEQFRQVVASEAEVTRDEALLLKGVFALGDTEVHEIMVPRVDIVGIGVDTSWSEVVDRVRSAQLARLMVFDGTLDEVVGILYAKDLLPAFVADEEPSGGWLTLVRAATFIPATKTVDAQLRDFRSSHRHIAIVVDEYGGTSGMITLKQLVEEIVGRVTDEDAPTEEPEWVRLDENTVRVDGSMRIDEANESLDMDLPEGDYETVAGLVLHELGHIPAEGEQVVVGELRLVVAKMAGVKVEQLHVIRS